MFGKLFTNVGAAGVKSTFLYMLQNDLNEIILACWLDI